MRLILALSALAMAVQMAQAEVMQAAVDGVTLNISAEAVKKQLGVPQKESMSEPNACNDDLPDMQLHYDGMLVTLSKDDDGAYTVTSIDVTSPNRSLGNVRIGDSAQKVKDIFGATDLARSTLSYDFGEPGSGQTYEFTIQNDRVRHIKLNSYMC